MRLTFGLWTQQFTVFELGRDLGVNGLDIDSVCHITLMFTSSYTIADSGDYFEVAHWSYKE
jgi:hypothetical protein